MLHRVTEFMFAKVSAGRRGAGVESPTHYSLPTTHSTQDVTFAGTVRHLGDVEFSGRATFNNDAAGYAKITKGARRVEVAFETAYEETPVVNVSLNDQGTMPNAQPRSEAAASTTGDQPHTNDHY